MSSQHPVSVWRVNAFTREPFTGNPAGVVPDADGLSNTLMQSIAAEVNDISETVFICRPEDPGADIKLRYFTSTTEVDLCGHATVSALFTLGWLHRVSGDNEMRTVRAETAVGVLELGLEFVDGQPAWASMEQLAPQMHETPGAGLAADVLGLPAGALSDDLPIQCASSGLWACFVPLRNLSWLQEVAIDSERIAQLWPENSELTGVYPFVLIDDQPTQCTTQGRFFSPPRYGILEDPVTGTACGALGAYLLANGRMNEDMELIARQGFEMGRGGSVRVSRNTNGKMRIRGQAVPVIEGKLVL